MGGSNSALKEALINLISGRNQYIVVVHEPGTLKGDWIRDVLAGFQLLDENGVTWPIDSAQLAESVQSGIRLGVWCTLRRDTSTGVNGSTALPALRASGNYDVLAETPQSDPRNEEHLDPPMPQSTGHGRSRGNTGSDGDTALKGSKKSAQHKSGMSADGSEGTGFSKSATTALHALCRRFCRRRTPVTDKNPNAVGPWGALLR